MVSFTCETIGEHKSILYLATVIMTGWIQEKVGCV